MLFRKGNKCIGCSGKDTLAASVLPPVNHCVYACMLDGTDGRTDGHQTDALHLLL